MIGTKLNHFTITAHLGSGGMGDVYQATDAKLGRSVAIKLLPEAFTHDHERAARFEREARVLASLNHSNIAAIYGIEESGGRKFLVMELVLGDTLAERIKRGPIPLEESLRIATQITDALEAAHEKGVVHRDLKPANIKATADGLVKVLDFGLAKAFAGEAANPVNSNSPTMSLMATQQGMILGTAAYMSPEQAKGKEVDRRTDIFAFGAVLYEMLTGRQAFGGEDVSDILGAVLKVDPDWTLLPASVPPAIQKLLKLCLQKDVKKRRQTATDVRIDIEQAMTEPREAQASIAPVLRPPLWKRAAPAIATLILGLLIAGGVMWSLRPAAPPAMVTQFSVALADDQPFDNVAGGIAVSPDGTRIAYASGLKLYLRSMGELDARVVPGTESTIAVHNPVFSPDGSSIAFVSGRDRTIKHIAVTGGAAISVVSVSPGTLSMDWSDEGILFAQRGRDILRVSANGGQPEPVVTVKSDEEAAHPQMLPGGKAVLFSLATGTGADRWDKAKVVLQVIGSAERKILIEGGSDARYLPSGHIVYAFAGTLRAVPFDLQRMEVTGGAVSVLEGVARQTTTGAALLSFSRNGSLVYVPGPASPALANVSDLTWIDREGHAEPLRLPVGSYSNPRIAPNGKQVAFQSIDGKESIIWIYDLAGGASMRRLTFGGNNGVPVWSPDSQRIAFQSDREGDRAIFQQRADGSGTAERLSKPDAGTSHTPDSWSPDGNTLLFEVASAKSVALWSLALPRKEATPYGGIQSAVGTMIHAAFSPDGRWLAYDLVEAGKTNSELFVEPFPSTGAKYQIPLTDGIENHAAFWSPDGKELFYTPGPDIFDVVRITTQPNFSIGPAVPVFKGAASVAPGSPRNFDIAPDGKRILDVALAGQGPGPAGGATSQFRVVLNWFDALKPRLPASK